MGLASIFMEEPTLTKVDELNPKEQLTNILINGKFPTSSFTFKNCCVGWVDIVESTKITAKLSKSMVSPFYCLFLSQMSSIVEELGGVVVKNVGDSLLYYFPKTTNTSDKSPIVQAIECGIKMIDYHRILNSLMLEIGLPNVSYRVSLDYGEVTITKPGNSSSDDIFGPTVNLCAKINKMAAPNTLVIGGDLYQIVKSFEGLRIESKTEYHNGLRLHYPVYSVTKEKY